ncbi:Protein ecm33 [Penicillium cataractarum]|uniref:Protein ecm33 n=1 Tax=Penicillium cataractarum TaxID=2100454 RepID=A0A9W9USZ2_9EURO|nr:Protein ecm33 [Penicillium cataractarum]KAJ5355449.1 Protein ecm33 [Penicillium cataractarum]
MSFAKYILPALAASQVAFAASCGDTTISSQSDADGIATCTKIKGDVTISKSFSGSLSISGVESITGSIICNGGENVTDITAASLTSIGDAFDLEGLTRLTQLAFAELTTVGSIKWNALPKLQSLNFDTGVTEAGDVIIQNTGLTSLDGISLKTVNQFEIENNLDLQTININNLQNATDLISFSGNYDALKIELPNLGTGTNMTFRNISSISVPSLEKLTGQLGFWGTEFTTFSAPNLTTTGDLVFNDNSKLSNISMPVLKTVNGGFLIARNDKLSTIDLPKLEKVTGAIDFSGKFNTVDLASLTDVEGGFNLQSTDGTFNCTHFASIRKTVIKGTYHCDAKTSDPTTSTGKSGTSSSSGSSSSATSSGAAVANGASIAVGGVAAFFYAVAQLL